jgi:lipoprotein-releasing system ATP-binding protein
MAVSSSSQFSIQPQQASSLIYIRGLHKTYLRGQERVEALRGVDLEVEQGEFLVIMGPSGGGKSTLLHLIGGIDRPTSGTLQVAGTALETVSEDRLTHFRRSHIGFIFQFYNLLPSINALENTALPLLARGIRRGEALKTAAQLLELVGLKDRLKHKPAQLSGGEQQRVAIARALILEPEILLADEPTGNLDTETGKKIEEILMTLNRSKQITLVVVTHNESLASRMSQQIGLRDGRIYYRE